MYKCVSSQVDSSLTDLLTSSWSPSHIGFCYFKVSVLVPLQWGYQMLSCFGFLTYPHTSHMCSAFSIWPKFNHIAVFALGLKSAYKREYMIFGFLSQAELNLPYEPAIPLLGIYPKECDTDYSRGTCTTHVYCSATHNSQDVPLLMSGVRKCGIYTQ
jgi:hypothetical protein